MSAAVDEGTSADTRFLAAIAAVAAIATEHVDDVDTKARFPIEAVDELRARGALGAYVSTELGGAGISFGALCDACYELAKACSATGMVFAMHQIQVASIARHSDPASELGGYLRELASEQRLIASATSEMGTGGDLRQSIAPIEPAGEGRSRFEKQAPTCSYGAHADDLLTTLRRDPDADRGDQVLALTRRGETVMEQLGDWDTLGMRGTCSPPFRVRAEFSSGQIVAAPFSAIAAETMVPFSHLLWAHVWLGIGADAAERAQAFVRGQARRSPGTTPPSAIRLSHLSSDLTRLRATVQAARAEYVAIMDEPGREMLSTLGYAVRINNLKTAVSEGVPAVCQSALQICGVVGYRNGTPFSIGRHLRDSLSAALMIANERIHATNATLLLMHKGM